VAYTQVKCYKPTIWYKLCYYNGTSVEQVKKVEDAEQAKKEATQAEAAMSENGDAAPKEEEGVPSVVAPSPSLKENKEAEEQVEDEQDEEGKNFKTQVCIALDVKTLDYIIVSVCIP